MPPTLPFDIWAHIASYLSIDQLKKLFNVNRALYEISMDARYKPLWLKYPDRRTVSKLRMMRDTVSIAGRIQDLNIAIWILDRLWMARSTRFQRLRTQFRRLFRLFSEDSTTPTTKSITSVHKILVEAVNNMHGLRSVYFDLYHGGVKRHLPMVDRVWSLLSGRVDSLSIRLWGGDAHLLHPTFSSLLGTKHLSVTLQGSCRSEAGARGLTNLINTTSSSLESFQLEIDGMDVSGSIPEIFGMLHAFPRLKRADFTFGITQVGSDVATFLNAHGESIEELKLATHRAAGVVPFSIASLQLPLLRNLSVDWTLLGYWHWDDIFSFHHLRVAAADFPMLDCLQITSPCIIGDHIAVFCNVFKRSSGNHLRRLELPCRTMNAEAFDHLSEAFPNLHTLILRTIYLSTPSDSIPRWNIESFAAEMENREYPTWTLYDLEITPVAQPFGFSLYPWPSYGVMRIAASHIPSIRSFCGSGHMDSPDGAE